MLSPLLSIATIRDIEHKALALVPPFALMYRAGLATARLAMTLAPEHTTPVLVVAGPGNNGSDAYEAAYQLARHHYAVTIAYDSAYAATITDAAHPYHRARTTNAQWITLADALQVGEAQWGLVIDGLFGIGASRPITGMLANVVNMINRNTCPVLAIDVPSGIDADTGAILGQDSGTAVMATHTITFIADKPGLHTCDGVAHSGHVTVETLDITGIHHAGNSIDTRHNMPECQLITPACFTCAFKPRHGNTHKGSFGDLMIVGGATGMAGAPVLSARAGLMSGAGRTFVAFAGPAPAYDALHPELMFRQADTVDFDRAVLVAGPGLGTSEQAQALVHRALTCPNQLVLDADALNLIAQDSNLQAILRQRAPGTTIITPHPLEAARLLGTTTQTVQQDRFNAARQLAGTLNAIAIVKGAGTVVATSPSQTYVNTTGNPALATGGTGDVLAGLCGALLAQHIPAEQAALAAVWIHGKAADNLVAQGIGPVGLSPGELIVGLRDVINTMTYSQ